MNAADAPVSATTVARLMTVVNDAHRSVADVVDVVVADAGLAARTLAVANSAAFGFSRRVTDVHQAISLIGSDLTQTLAIAGSCNLLDSGLPHARRHALATAVAARWIAARSGLHQADAFAAGLLHDLGEILLFRQDPALYSAQAGSFETPMDQLRFERGAFETDHALVARQLLAEWQLPGQVVDAVGDHHRPDMSHLDLSTCIVCAEELADPAIDASPRFAVFGIDPGELDIVRIELAELTADMDAAFSAV